MEPRSVAEGLVWLSFDPSSGKPVTHDGHLDVAIAGAVIADLAIRGRIDLASERIAVVDGPPTGVDILDEALQAIADEKPEDPQHWISALARRAGRFRADVVDEAVTSGALEHRTRVRLKFFPTHRWIPVAGSPIDTLSREVTAAVSTSGAPMTPPTGALVAILDAAQMLASRFPTADPGQVATAKAATWADDAVRDAVERVNVAVMAAVTVATTAAITGSISSN